MPRPGSITANIDAADKVLAQYPPAQGTNLLLRAGFTDVCVMLGQILTALEDANRLTVRALRNEPNQE